MGYSKNQKLGLWIFLITAIIIIVGLLMNRYNEKRLAKDAHVITCVKIDGIYFRRGGIFIDFGYSFNLVNYHTGSFNEASITKESYQEYEDGKRNILIVILKKNPEIWDILENENDFKKYNIIPSDTASIKCENLILNSAVSALGPVPSPPGITVDTVK
jgi:hypothetical protein